MFRQLWVPLLTTIALGDIVSDRIETLPGYVKADGSAKPLPVKHWSGYIEVPVASNASAGSPAGTAFVHYWLVENSAGKSDAPTVVWQQGGPGGSSLIGLFTENGPLTLNDASFKTSAYKATGIPTVFDNPFSWHNAPANMLYVEHPAPTGFSYCVPANACKWDDSNQAIVSYEFYVRFFKAFPELASNDFFFSGESYAGVLVPTVALQILKHRTDENTNRAPWNLKGFLLGNDCPGNQIYTCTPYSGWRGVKVALDFRFGHGMIPESLYSKIYEACSSWWGNGKPFPDGPDMFSAPPEPCKTLLEDPVRPCKSVAGDTYDMGGGYYLYDTCSQDMLALDKNDNLPHPERFALPAQDVPEDLGRQLQAPPTSPEYANTDGEYACGQERASTAYLNLPAVQRAAHVRLVGKKRFDFSTGLHYKYTALSLLDEYKDKLLPNFRILQFSGDADPCVPYVGTKRWIDFLDLPIATPWRPWSTKEGGLVAGYSQVYSGEGIGSTFTFTTIRSAGHMVPRYKPSEAFHMFKSFLNDHPLRVFV